MHMFYIYYPWHSFSMTFKVVFSASKKPRCTYYFLIKVPNLTFVSSIIFMLAKCTFTFAGASLRSVRQNVNKVFKYKSGSVNSVSLIFFHKSPLWIPEAFRDSPFETFFHIYRAFVLCITILILFCHKSKNFRE